MNHDREHKVVRLRNLALLVERGALDRDLEAAELELDDGQRLRVVGAIRHLADTLADKR